LSKELKEPVQDNYDIWRIRSIWSFVLGKKQY
jgi:hypothetical protein